MRQAGILAEAGMFALDNNVNRLVEDHENARAMAQGLASFEEIKLEHEHVESNIIYFELKENCGVHGPSLVKNLERHGVLIGGGYAKGSGFRAVTHANISSNDIQYAIEIFERCLMEQKEGREVLG